MITPLAECPLRRLALSVPEPMLSQKSLHARKWLFKHYACIGPLLPDAGYLHMVAERKYQLKPERERIARAQGQPSTPFAEIRDLATPQIAFRDSNDALARRMAGNAPALNDY
jgi:hypothetical protein